ncbi:MAG: (5-formylfuran-3-yl)methyl phosphate synthase [Pirellulales bacterium]|nr:(5-formylfuran-3-yl)methyl phosphate synthase [Pirellulales bacterium]
MTGLLVSVRSASEARIALAAGVDVIDVKEPNRGSLGAASTETIAEIVQVVGARLPVSAALGELLDWLPANAAQLPAGLTYAKFGLAGCAKEANWPDLWRAAAGSLPASVRPVAVVYADHLAACSPTAEAIVAAAESIGAAAVLVDTFDKRGGNLLSHWTIDQARWLIDQAQSRKWPSVLAGSLTADAIAPLLPLAPSLIAVRGAACAHHRTGEIDAARVGQLVRLVNSSGLFRSTARPAHFSHGPEKIS